MSALLSIIPATVIAAGLLFVLKEIIESIRRYRGEGRKKKALRTLLARECELNNWTIKSIRNIVETIRDESKDDEQTEFGFIFPKSGKVLFRVKYIDRKFKGGSSLGEIYRDVMSKNLLEVAMLDKKLFSALQPAYDAIADLEHIRDSLIYFVDPEDDQDKMHLDGFIHYALRELERVHEQLNKLHIECTGDKLKGYRLR